MQDFRPALVGRAKLAWRVFTEGLPQTKAAPFIWPDFRTGKPIWHNIDLASYIAEGFNLNTLIYECIMYKVRAMTAAPLRAYQGDIDSPEPLPREHELSKLLRRPNEHQSWPEFQSQNVVYKNLAGNCYVFLDRPAKGKMPVAMYSMRPDRVLLIPDKKKRYSKTGLMGYLYVPEGKTWREGTPILPEYMIHIKFPNPADPYEGMGEGLSPISPLAQSADIDNQITKYLKVFFEKGAMQSGAVSYGIPLTQNKVAQLREQFAETYGGAENWYKPIVLDSQGKYERMSLTFDEMGFESLDQRNETRILGPFGVPPILVGSRVGLENSPWSNIGEARRIFWEDTMLPESMLDEVEYDYHLGGGGIFLRFDTSDVPALRRDVVQQADAAYKLWQMGVPRDHALSTVGLDVEQQPDGQTSYIPMSMLPAGEKREEPEEEEEEKSYPSPHEGLPGVWGGSRPREGDGGDGNYRRLETDEELDDYARDELGKWKYEGNAQKALIGYREQTYNGINGYLRAQGTAKQPMYEELERAEKLKADIEAIDSAIAEHELPENITVYRGMSTKYFGLESMAEPEGAIIHDKAFVSASLELRTAEGFALREGRDLVEIRLPSRTHAAWIPGADPSTYAENDFTEYELLLPRGSSFRVLSVETRERYEYVIVELIE